MSDYIKELRKKIGTDRILIPSTAAIIVNKQGEILLQERAGQKNWGCPGGLMDLNETVLESLKREVLEETGLTFTSPTLFGIYSGERYKGVYPNGDMIQSVQMVFLVTDFSGQLKTDKESLSLQFFPVSKFPESINKHHAEYLAHYREYIQGKRKIPIIV